MKGIVYRYYNKNVDINEIKRIREQDNENNMYNISFISGDDDIMYIIKELIKDKLKGY